MSSVAMGLVGAGRWGMTLARVLAGARGAELRAICEVDGARRARAAAAHPRVSLAASVAELLSDPAVQAVVVAVDSPRHHEVARQALTAGRHVLVEKPMALSSADAAELVELARARDRCLMVGHVLLYHPAVERARELIAAGELGQIFYVDATRVAFGTVRPNESVWWSVGPHDVSLAHYLLGALPSRVSATGAAYVQPGRPDVVFAALHFPDGRLAHVHVSWLAPGKHRALTVVGARKMLTFDEGSAERPLVIHDRSITDGEGHAAGPRVHAGESVAPALPTVEPLLAECEHFADCVARGQRPRSDGAHALGVIRVLEAGERSMRAGGALVEVV